MVRESFAPVRPRLEQSRSRRRDDHHRSGGQHAVGRVQPGERGVVGPVQVLQQHHHRRPPGEVLEVPGEQLARAVAQSLRVGRDVVERRPLEPQPARHHPGVLGRCGRTARTRRRSPPRSAQDRGGGVARGDAEPGGHGVAQQGVRAVLPGGRRAAAEPPDRVRPLLQPRVQLPEQPGLADPGVADERRDPPGRLLHDVGEVLLQGEQLEVTADRAGLHPADAGGPLELEAAGPLGEHDVGVHRLVDPLEPQAGSRVEAELAAHLPAGVLADEHHVLRRLALQPAGPVHGRADGHELVARPLAQGADHHVAGVEPDPHPQPLAEPALDVVGHLAQRLDHRRRRAHRADRVVLAGAVQAEHGHHGVADELLDHAAVLLDHPLPAREAGADDVAGVLGVEPAREHGEADQVGEQDGDELALLADLRRSQRGTPLEQRTERGGDDGVTEDRALGLQRRDRRVEVGALRHERHRKARNGVRGLVRYRPCGWRRRRPRCPGSRPRSSPVPCARASTSG